MVLDQAEAESRGLPRKARIFINRRLLRSGQSGFDQVAFKDSEPSLAFQPHQLEMDVDGISERDVFNRQAASSPQMHL